MATIRLDIWSDIACPWCWVGKRHLEAAMKESEHTFEVMWRAFQLNPAAPTEHDPSVDYVQRLADKYGVSKAQSQEMIDRMTTTGESVGIEFDFSNVQPVNTFDGHRLLHYAHTKGKQDEVKDGVFKAYMSQGRSVSDHDTLVDIAEAAGLDPEATAAMLASDDFRDAVAGDRALSAKLGITGVPFFVINGKVAVSGAQPAEHLQRAFEVALSQAAEAEESESDPAAESCGPDGCAV